MCTVKDHRRRVTACKEQHFVSCRTFSFFTHDVIVCVTHVKISQTLTGLFAQQPYSNTVDIIEDSIMFQHIVESTEVVRVCCEVQNPS